MLTLFLERAGAEVVCAESGNQALALIEQSEREGRPFALVVSDMMMPDLDGLEFARAVRARGWQMPVIACSAAVMPHEQAACLAAGCNTFVAKPIQRAALLEACVRWLT